MNIELYQRVQQGQPTLALLEHRAFWRLTGSDRVRYLNGQITNDVTRLRPGYSLYAALTTAKGKMVSDLFVHCDIDSLYLDAPLERQEAVTARLEKYLIADDAILEDITSRWQGLHLFSPPAHYTSPLSFRNSRYGLPGLDVFYERNPPPPEFPLLDSTTVETLRIEQGLAVWGLEMDENTLPPEAGLDRQAIRYDKGCYVGQETMARIKSMGHVTKSLALLQFHANSAPVLTEPILLGDKTIGRLTSLTHSPQHQAWLALGYLHYPHNVPGQVVNTLNNSATVLELPSIAP